MTNDALFDLGTMNAPWGLQSRVKLVATACQFFNVNNTAANHAAIGKELPTEGNPGPLTVNDFLKYLKIKRIFLKPPNALRVALTRPS